VSTSETETTAPVHTRATQGEEILRIEGLVKHFPIRAGIFKRTVGQIHAVDGVDLDLSGLAQTTSINFQSI